MRVKIVTAAALAVMGTGLSIQSAAAQFRWDSDPYYERYDRYEPRGYYGRRYRDYEAARERYYRDYEPPAGRRYGRYGSQDGLPSQSLMRIARQYGLSPVGQPLRRGNVYTLSGVDANGNTRRLFIDARSGSVIRSQMVGRPPVPGVDRSRASVRSPDYSERAPRDGLRRGDQSGEGRFEAARGDDGTSRGRRLAPVGGRAAAPRDETSGRRDPGDSSVTYERQPEPNPRRPDDRRDRTPADAGRRDPGVTASAPSSAPLPRARPVQNTGTGTPQSAGRQPEAATPPRVILEGGPAPKSERVADKEPQATATAPAAAPSVAPSAAPAPAQPASPPAATSALPPVNPLE